MSNRYDASALEVLSGLDPVRKRPGMYTDTRNPNHLAHEVVDNSVDEALAGHANHIEVRLEADGSLTVKDNGRGLPTDMHAETGLSGVELIFTRLHAGAKFSDRHYRFAGGLHGVGVSVVNALSQWLNVSTVRAGKRWAMAFAGGEVSEPLKQAGKAPRNETGTQVQFCIDPKYFTSPAFDLPALKTLLRAKALLCPGLTIQFEHAADAAENETWAYGDGLSGYLTSTLAGDAELIPETPIVGKFEQTQGRAEWAVAWFAEPGRQRCESYVNLVPTARGGSHVGALRQGLVDAVRAFCSVRDLLPRGLKLAPEDVWQSAACVLSLGIPEPRFSGQTKERLDAPELMQWLPAAVSDALSLWMHRHVDVAERIAQLAIANAHGRLRANRAVARKRVASGPALPGKLADCLSQDLEATELFLVEGDSAGGSAKQARDRQFQAILPLRGKILNTWEVASSEVLASREVHDVAVALGVDPGAADLSGLRYGRVCLLADADSDGAHIAALLCALFTRHFPTLVEAGRIHAVMPPLYRVDCAKQVFYALNDAERDGIIAKLQKGNGKGGKAAINVQRFKGLGEMNPAQLRETSMNPATRRLVQLQMSDRPATCATLDRLLAKKRAAERKAWLTEHGDRAALA